MPLKGFYFVESKVLKNNIITIPILNKKQNIKFTKKYQVHKFIENKYKKMVFIQLYIITTYSKYIGYEALDVFGKVFKLVHIPFSCLVTPCN